MNEIYTGFNLDVIGFRTFDYHETSDISRIFDCICEYDKTGPVTM